MKKILSILSIVAAAVMMTVCVSCKKDEPSKSLDFSKMSLELVESLYGQDSATVVSALIEQGFEQFRVVDTPMKPYYYLNKSYGLAYGFTFEKMEITEVMGQILNLEEKDKELYLENEQKLTDKHLTYFIGFVKKDNEFICTENTKEYLQWIKENYIVNQSLYANSKLYYSHEWYSDPKEPIYYNGYMIYIGKSDPDDPYGSYNYAKYGCGYDPYK